LPHSSPTEPAVARDIATLRQALYSDLLKYPQKIARERYLIVLSGLPGNGKSHFANKLSQRIPVLIVGSDRIRKALVAKPKYNPGEHARVFSACHQLIEDLLQEGYRVVFDATNLTESVRHTLYDIAENTETPLSIIWFTAPIDVVRRRLDARAAGLSIDSHSDADWQIHCRLRPSEEPINRPHLIVDSSQDISPLVDQVVRLVNAASDRPDS
jgi:predicted kinase